LETCHVLTYTHGFGRNITKFAAQTETENAKKDPESKANCLFYILLFVPVF